MVRIIQIVPAKSIRLFGLMVKKEVELSRRNQGTFYRASRKKRNQAKWSHRKHKGWINIQRGEGEVVTAEILSRTGTDEWQLLQAFIGWLDRHFGKELAAINIQYRK
jgi:hypothetical protein